MLKQAALLAFLAAASAAWAVDAPPPGAAPAAAKPTPVPVQPGVNLVQDGDFEAVQGAQPAHWEPLAHGVSVVDDKAPQGHVLRLDADLAAATSSGIKYRSEPMQAEVGRQYDIKLKARTSGISALVWVRAYGDFNGQERELYNHKKEIQFDKPNVWTDFESFFTVQRPVGAAALARRGRAVPTPQRMRVELFCFGGRAGHVDFDNITLAARPIVVKTPVPTPVPTPIPTLIPMATPMATPAATPAPDL